MSGMDELEAGRRILSVGDPSLNSPECPRQYLEKERYARIK